MTSFHQPFLSPDAGILAIAEEPATPEWRAIHVLSGGCACSQRIMKHLLARPALDGAVEQVVLIDGEEAYLAGSQALIAALQARGYQVSHRLSKDVPQQLGLRGVPLLIVASPAGKVLYTGGYGKHEDQDVEVYGQVRSTGSTTRLPVLGCAVGRTLRHSIDPLRLKY